MTTEHTNNYCLKSALFYRTWFRPPELAQRSRSFRHAICRCHSWLRAYRNNKHVSRSNAFKFRHTLLLNEVNQVVPLSGVNYGQIWRKNVFALYKFYLPSAPALCQRWHLFKYKVKQNWIQCLTLPDSKSPLGLSNNLHKKRCLRPWTMC